MIILVALGLAAVDIITLSSLHSYLYGRVDDQLDQRQTTWCLSSSSGPTSGRFAVTSSARRSTAGSARTSTSRSWTPADTVVRDPPVGHALARLDPAPRLPAPGSRPARADRGAEPADRHGTYRPTAASVTVGSRGRHGPEYRLQASSLPGGHPGGGHPPGLGQRPPCSSLRHVELAVSLGVLLALFVLLMLCSSAGGCGPWRT